MPHDFTGKAFSTISVMLGSDRDGTLFLCDALEEDSGLVWLVPEWLESPSEGLMYPARIILMNNLRYQRVDQADHRYLLNEPIPTTVLNGGLTAEKFDYVVIEQPAIALPSGKGIH